MTSREEAVRLVREVVDAEVAVMKEIANRGRVTKKTDAIEIKAVRAIFEKLTGQEAESLEVAEMIGG